MVDKTCRGSTRSSEYSCPEFFPRRNVQRLRSSKRIDTFLIGRRSFMKRRYLHTITASISHDQCPYLATSTRVSANPASALPSMKRRQFVNRQYSFVLYELGFNSQRIRILLSYIRERMIYATDIRNFHSVSLLSNNADAENGP